MRDIQRERAEIIKRQCEDMKRFGRLPKGYENWLRTTLFDDRFMAYNNKTRTAFCTVCGQEHEIPKKVNYHNNEPGICPVCGANIVYHRESLKTGRDTYKWSLLIQSSGEDVLFRYILNEKKYSDDYRTVEYSVNEKLRTVSGKKSERTWEYFWGSNSWLPWRDEQFNFWHTATKFDVPLDGFTVYKPERVRNTIKNTWAKYSGLEAAVYMDKLTDKAWALEWYLRKYKRQPQIEKLAKVGLNNLTSDTVLNWYDTGIELQEGNTLAEVLGMTKYQTKLLLHCGNPVSKEFKFVKDFPDVKMEVFDAIRKNELYLTWYKTIMSLSEFAPVLKFVRYFDSQNLTSIRDYDDYIGWLRVLGYDMHNKGNLFPADFMRAHDRIQAEYQEYQDKKKAAEMAQYDALIRLQHDELLNLEPMKLKMNGLMLVVPNGKDDLKKEGEALHHCVATYAERVAKKETMIFFIRKESEPDKPYYTLEWKGNIRQCRGFGNKDMSDDVREFVNRFDSDMRKLSA